MRALVSLFIAAVLLIAPGSVAAASTAPARMKLPDCAGDLVERPASVILTCADAGVTAGDLSWTGWGSTFAAAVGVASVNDCEPTCVAGHFHDFKIVLIADGRQRCAGGVAAYAKVTYAFIGRSPYPQNAPGTADPVVTYRCK